MGFGLMAALGLLGLIGIPILIIIYILKPKFQEKKISSTYIWKLSLKYRKRKIPLQWLKSLLLIVQCIIVAIIAFLLAKPYISKAENSYDYRKIVVVDASASMMTVEDGKTRFERAVDKACDIAETASEEDPMTVILCTDEATVVCDNASDPGNIQRLLKSQTPKGTSANYPLAITEALNRAGGSEAGFTLITDKDFDVPGYYEVINVSQGATNLAVLDAWEDVDDREFVEGKENLAFLEAIFKATYYSYNEQMTIVPCAEITFPEANEQQVTEDGMKNPLYGRAPLKITLPAIQLAPVPDENGNVRENVYGGTATFDYNTIRNAVGTRLSVYKSIKFYAMDQNGQVITDAFRDDDEYYVMADGSDEKFKLLLVTDDAQSILVYLSGLLGNIGVTTVDTVSPADITPQHQSGYDVYVYENYCPQTMPNDGSILFVNPPSTGDYSKYGFSIGAKKTALGLEVAKIFQNNAGHALMTAVTELDSLFLPGQKGVFTYSSYTTATITNRKIAKLVMSQNGQDPLIFSGETSGRIKFVVMSFDMKSTDFPFVYNNYAIFLQNIIANNTQYTLLGSSGRPEYGDYAIGDEVTVNVEPNAVKLEITVGEGANAYTKTYDNVVDLNKAIKYTTTRGGLHSVTQTLQVVDGTQKPYTKQFYVKCDDEESDFAKGGGTLTTEDYEFKTQGSGKRKEPIYKYFAGALLALLIIEWWLQYREQY